VSHENSASGFTITDQEAGTRLDLFLAKRLKLSRNQIKRLLSSGGIRLNNRVAVEKDKGLLLYAGSVVTVGGDAKEASGPVGQMEMELVVLNRGPGWVAVDKPAEMAVHPLEAKETGTLLNAVVAREPGIVGVGEGGLKSGVVHRLDTDTSGVVLFATRQETWEALRREFEEHRAKKIYRAIVQGQLRGSKTEQMPLIVAQHRPAKVKVTEPDHPKARMCNLTWRAVEQFDSATLLEIELGTGFLHQIRVMLAHLGHPVLGDTTYGEQGRSGTFSVARQMLHASYVRAGIAQGASPDPLDFAAVLQRKREQGQ